MVKYYLILFVLATTFLSAQKPNGDKRYQEIAGRYGGNDGVCLFDDGTFLLYGYATAVFGTYLFEKDYINFYPDKQELFMIFGSQNPAIGNSARLYFSGFERDKTVVQFDQSQPQQVFNDDANCFGSPYVYETKSKPSQIILSVFTDGTWQQSKFTIPKEYNDLAIVHNAPSRYEENFSGMVKSEGQLKVLNISMNDRDFKKSDESKNDNNWKEILEMKAAYDQTKESGKDVIYFNKHYNNFPTPESSAYTFDKKTNQYVSKNAQDNEAYFRDNQYNDDRYLRKYLKIDGQSNRSNDFNKNSLSPKSLFYSTCGKGSQKSYIYGGLKKNKPENENQQPLQMLKPTPTP